MQFARVVKEFYEANVFPMPLGLLEQMINMWAEISGVKNNAVTDAMRTSHIVIHC
jgi:hypothetical protein